MMDYYKILRENVLFASFSDNDLKKLLEISNKMEVEKGNYFIREGDRAENFYFILSGEVVIAKSDESHEHEHTIASLRTGDTVGEMSLLDHLPRSASAKAVTPVELLSISFRELKNMAEQSPSFVKLLLSMTENISARFRHTNTAVVTALESQLKEYKMRMGLGLLLVNSVVAICLFAFLLTWLTTQQSNAVASTWISLPLTIGFVGMFVSIMKNSGLPLRTFGLTTQNWRKAMRESILFTLVLCIVVVIAKWIFIHTTQEFRGHDVFEPFVTINVKHSSYNLTNQKVWWMIFGFYCLIIVPLQELVARGALQGPLEIFLPGNHTVVKAIVISNLMFSTSHLFLGTRISLMVFGAGLYFGWLYSRHRTLIGVIFAHAILGTWATMIVGF